MRRGILGLLVAALLAGAAAAELQEVSVGGSFQIRGDYIRNALTAAPALRVPAFQLPGRAVGGPFNPNVATIFTWDDDGASLKLVEQRTRLHVDADFSNSNRAFIEVDSYDFWGQDFRSNYLTGADRPANSVNDVEIYQAYIESEELFGYPLRLRAGRQEMAFGSQWLVGTNDFALLFSGLSFDALRLTYAADTFSVDAWWSKVAENSPLEEDGDVDFYGLYGSYTGIENMTLDSYWMLVRDARSINDTNYPFPLEWVEDAFGIDDYDVTELHTVGLRAAGMIPWFKVDAEISYQFGEADAIGSTFRLRGYGDDGASFDNWGGRIELAHPFDVKHQPVVFGTLVYLGGEDHRGVNFWQWLNPFYRPDASVSFNRLFSNQIYSGAADMNNDLSNAWIGRLGVTANVTEKLNALLCATYFEALEPFEMPRHFVAGRYVVPIAPAFSFWDDENEKDLGVDLALFFTYNYTEDLVFEAGWAHFFTGEGMGQGNYSRWHGLMSTAGKGDDDADYIYLGTKLSF